MSIPPLFCQPNDLLDTPNVIADSGFHRRRDPERLVNPREVVIHEVQGHCVPQVVDLLRERVGQPREPAHGHPHREVQPFDVAGRDVLGIRISGDGDGISAEALRRAGSAYRSWARSHRP